MQTKQSKTAKRERRHARIRAKVFGTEDRPRLAVFRSNKFVYAQLIDDAHGTTLAQATSKDIKDARGVGEAIAKQATAQNITKAVFDRGGFLFAGSVKAVAEGARAGGLSF